MTPVPLSLLDLVPIREGSTPGTALDEVADLAVAAENAGYERFWTAEHHGATGLAGAAVSVVLAHIGHATRRIRIGAGGIMLPNHNPLVIAEQFGTLDALFPGRIDLGLGRAPGADSRIAHALRKDLMQSADNFPQDVVELQARLAGDDRLAIRTMPGEGANVELWILGSSLFGAQLAALLGLPYAFASHFAPAHLDAALETYRAHFKPSETLDKPHVMAAMTVVAADTDEDARYLSSTLDQSFVAFRSGQSTRLQPPVRDYRENLPASARAMLDTMNAARAIGSVRTVRETIAAFLERTQADELVVAGALYDPAERIRSIERTMEAVGAVTAMASGH